MDRYANIAVVIEDYANITFVAAFCVCVVLIVYGTVVKNRWGINLRQVSCPDCGTALARVRKPGSVKQALWGGYTCPKCQCELDKWGRQTTTEDV